MNFFKLMNLFIISDHCYSYVANSLQAFIVNSFEIGIVN